MVPTPQESIWQRPLGRALVVVGVLVAFAPVVIDWGRHLVAYPWARGAACFPVLFVLAIWRDRGEAKPFLPGLFWGGLVCGLLIMLLAIGGDALRFARIGFVIAAFASSAGAGWARPDACALAFWFLPLPTVLANLGSPGGETALARLLGFLPGVEVSSIAGRPELALGEGLLPLVPTDTGLPLALGLSGVGWFRGVCRGEGGTALALTAVRWGLCALAIQIGCVAGCLELLGWLGESDWPRLVLDHLAAGGTFVAAALAVDRALRGTLGSGQTDGGASPSRRGAEQAR